MATTSQKQKPTLPLMTFRLAEGLAEFRYRVEQVFAWSADLLDPETDDPDSIPDEAKSIPPVVQETLKRVTQLTESVTTTIGGRPGFDQVGKAVRLSAARALDRLVRCWHKRGHLNRIYARNARRRNASMLGSEIDRVKMTLDVLAGSPFGPDRWEDYELAVRSFECGLPRDYESLFTLGWLLGRIVYPSTKDHVLAGSNNHWVRQAKTLLPGIRAALAWSVSSVPRLGELRVEKKGDLVEALFRLRGKVAVELGNTPDVGLAASPSSLVDLAEYRRLRAIKDDLTRVGTSKTSASGDPSEKNHYVGDSVPILRVFEQIDICRKAGFRVILLLGPKGTGKTSLADIIHRSLMGCVGSRETGVRDKAGERNQWERPFRWQASNSQSSDPLGPRSHWIGFAANSGYRDIPSEGRKGLLKECVGGSIFIDEFGDLHPDVQTLLLDVAEGQEVVPVGGKPTEAFKPDVRLILATNKDVRTAVRGDLLDRIGMKIWIPPLRDRPEDVVLLVRHYLRGTSFTLSLRTWLLLLAHDWPGNVRELERALERVRAAYVVKYNPNPSAKDVKDARVAKVELPHVLFLEVEALRKTADRMGDSPGVGADECRLFNYLKTMLEARGYHASSRGSASGALYSRMGELLGWHKSKVTRLKQQVERYESGFPRC